VRASDPWSLVRNSDRWRTNPLIDDGRYLSGTIGLALDTRNSVSFPSSGWLVRASYDQNWSDKVAPLLLPISIRRPIPTNQTYNFGRISLDARRYMRISPALRVGTRLFAEGWVGGDDLPVQRRYSLGGTDLMPGYNFRQVTCAPPGFEGPAQAAFCNRMIALQVEVRTRLSFGWAYRLRDRERAELDRLVAIDQADLVFLADAGTAWIAGDGPGQIAANKLPAGSQWKYDVGVGLDLGGVGVYLAKALTDNVPIRLILRLQRRF
jgi:outer membrane protein assembly factor BamA